MVKKIYANHAHVISPDKLLDTLNEQGAIGYRTVSIQLDRPGGNVLVIFEHETDLG
jgi:hypothetical protein